MKKHKCWGGHQREGERLPLLSDQAHLSLACTLRVREQQVCLLHVHTWVFCVWRNEAAGIEVVLALPLSLLSSTLASGPAELQVFFQADLQDSCPQEDTACVCPLVMNKYLGIFTLTISPVDLLADVSVCALTSFCLACCSRFLTSLPTGLDAPVSSASPAYLELGLVFPDHRFQDTISLTFPWLVIAE